MRIGDTLWVANDETISLERLSRQGQSREDAHKFGEHTQFALHDFLRLPVPPPSDPDKREQIEEADVEGLDYSDGYLWLVGSHSLKRKKPDEKESVKENFERREGKQRWKPLHACPYSRGRERWTYTLDKKFKDRTAAQLRGNHKDK